MSGPNTDTAKSSTTVLIPYLQIPRTDIKQMLRGLAWYASGRHRRLRLNFPAAIERMCSHADAVICTTEAQKHAIAPFCGNVHIILDIQDNAIRSRKSDYSAGDPFNLVWEGLPSNIPYLKSIGRVLPWLSRRAPIVLNIVTDPDRPQLFGRFGKSRASPKLGASTTTSCSTVGMRQRFQMSSPAVMQQSYRFQWIIYLLSESQETN